MIKWLGVGILLTPLVIIFLFISLFFINPLFNDSVLSRFENQFNNHAVPASTEILESQSVLGKLNGNGNGLDFFACFLLKSSLTIGDLNQYYQKQKFKNAKRSGDDKVLVEVLPVTSDSVNSDYLERHQLTFKTLENIDNYSGYYFVVIYDGGYPSGFDIRGH